MHGHYADLRNAELIDAKARQNAKLIDAVRQIAQPAQPPDPRVVRAIPKVLQPPKLREIPPRN
jgi:hypothetical protein